MGLFQTLKDKIFGSDEAKAVAAKKAPAPAPAAPRPAAAAAPAAAPAPPPPQPVDVHEVLAHMAEKSGQPSNYKSSIVDLMKLVGMDSSLAARKELAEDLGYTGALDGSAEMNLWLHKKVMERLATTTA
jgi:3-oxoacyl-ACP reductase-like protein